MTSLRETIEKPIYLSTRDHENLRLRLSMLTDPRSRRMTEKLRKEVDRAHVVPPNEIPETVIQIGSQVALLDLDTDERESYTLVLPELADPAAGRLSVFAPLGTALIGFSLHDEIAWEMPGGTRRLRVERVTKAPAP
jgi:regulator of nucleoside diphosphate kinase